MAKAGKLLRGLKWYNFRNLEGEFPEEISKDSNKMEEMQFYLDFVKIRDAKKVHEILEQVMYFDLSNKPVFMENEAKKLESEDLLIKTKSKGKK